MTESNRSIKYRRMRLMTRWCALAAAVVVLVPLATSPDVRLVLPALSPYVAIGSVIAARSVGLVTLIAVPILVAVLVRRRWFCRWACPVGLLADCAAGVSPVPRSWCEKLPSLGRWAVLATVAGACAGYPIFLWLDPLALLSGLPGLWRGGLTLAALAAGMGVPLVLLISLLLPGVWCRRICPLGATQDFAATPRLAWRRYSAGKLAADEELAQVAGLSPAPVARRSLLAMALGGAWAAAGVVLARRALGVEGAANKSRPLRPPGAVADPRFAGLCVRCGNCVSVCPAGVVHADLGGHGVAGLLAPVVRFEEDFCRADCNACLEACPSGAIARLPLEEKRQAKIGVAVVELGLCLLYYDKECDTCRRVCPYEAVTFAWNEEEYIRSPVIDLEKCPGCGACQVACPGNSKTYGDPDKVAGPLRKAIRVGPMTG